MPEYKSWVDKGTAKIWGKPEYANRNYTVIKNALPEKMSTVLLNFAQPLIETVDMSDKLVAKSTIQMATFIWNYAVIKSGETSASLPDALITMVVNEVEKQQKNDPIFKSVIDDLLERKISLYPDNNRMISDFDISWSNNGASMHLTVFTPD